MNNSILIVFCHVKIWASEFLSGRVNFCPGELILKLLARIGEWPQNLNEKTGFVTVKRLPFLAMMMRHLPLLESCIECVQLGVECISNVLTILDCV